MALQLLHTVATIKVAYQARLGINENAQGTHRLVQGRDFDSSHQLRCENLSAFFPDREPELYAIHEGDVLFQARGVKHFAYCIEDDLRDTLAASSFYIVRPRDANVLPEYLAWWLNQSRAQAYFRSHAGGTGISFVSKTVLSRLEIEIPSLGIQQKIVRTVELQNRERLLLERLSSCRAKLVNAICNKTVAD